MSNAKAFLQIGAWLCIMIGGLYSVVTFQLLFPVVYVTRLQAVVLVIYTTLAFLPFAAFVYPKLNSCRSPVR